jgi:spermidine synthase
MSRSRSFLAEIGALSFAALVLEVGYTRVVSFKFFYFYAYLVLGLAMLGLGSGAVAVALASAWPRRSLEALVARACALGSTAVAAGYLALARAPFDTERLWSGLAEPLKLVAICLALYAGFFAIGVAVAAILARRPSPIHRLYFADLLGAGLGAAAVVPLLGSIGPPACIFLSAALLAATGLAAARGGAARGLRLPLAAATALFAAPVAAPQILPDPLPDRFGKHLEPRNVIDFSRWSPVFRIDVSRLPDVDDRFRAILHDGLWGSSLFRFDGDPVSLSRFDADPRAFPFAVLGAPAREVALIGSAGGHEILASLHFGARRVTAVELNPVTVSLLSEIYPEYTGNLHLDPRVELVNAEGRAYLAGAGDRRFDLVYFMAPDSYSAMNAASAGAFVLSESYLYTVEAIESTLARLSRRGIVCAQFGEWSYEDRPLRSARYAATAREAFRRAGVSDFAKHVLVATTPGFLQLTTVLLKREPFTPAEVERFLAQTQRVPGTIVRHAGGRAFDDGALNDVILLADAPLRRFTAAYPYRIDPVRDDAPFFWHFARFRSVLAGLFRPFAVVDAEVELGERLVLLLLAVAVLLSALLLLFPFARSPRTWRALPHKGRAALYFGALGLGFLCYEIPLIQRLTLLVGYPTHSLTVTLAALLVASGIGSLVGGGGARRGLPWLFAGLVALTLFYRFGLGPCVDRLLAAPFGVRVAAAVGCVAPLGLLLGRFLPLGLAAFSAATGNEREAVAWGWAVNGFASVVASVLATVLAMGLGFDAVMGVGLAAYALALAALRGRW